MFSKKAHLYIIGRSVRDGQVTIYLNWLTNGILFAKFYKIGFFYKHSQLLYDVMQKEMDSLEIVQGVNFDCVYSLKNNGTNDLLIFGISCEEIRNSKLSVDFTNAGRHRGLSTFHFRQNLFHQSKLGQDVELQNTHIALFKPPRDEMQVSTLSAKLVYGSELVDWCRDATSVPYG